MYTKRERAFAIFRGLGNSEIELSRFTIRISIEIIRFQFLRKAKIIQAGIMCQRYIRQ